MKIAPFTWLALSFFGYYCAYGVFVPFFPVWLKSQAYGAETIGLILASSYLFRFIGGIFFSALVKRASQLLNALRYLAWLSCAVMSVIAFLAQSFWLLCAAIWLFAMLNAAGMPLSDTLASTWQKQIQLDYGKARLIGSAAFVVGVTLFGYLIGIIGEASIIWILAALLGLYAVMQMNSPHTPPHDEAESAVENTVTFKQLLKDNTTLRLLIAISLIQGSHAAYYAYSVLYWTDSGLSVQTTSLLWGLSVVAEIVLFFFSTKLFKHWNVSRLFYLSALAAALRWGVLGSTQELAVIASAQLLHSLTYAAGHYAMVRYITTQPQNAIAKLQGLYNGLSGCAAVALLTALSGVLYPLSPSLTFAVMSAVALIALLFIPPKVEAFLLRNDAS
ncbi:3-phenylpropionate MFS transporter [Necropsobacter massiliensis]|uniref:3-phenylpropionate MFS transporter n=1 Tax=Necropsobacter massiliensis TaxID=1400001 RepID=UPI000595D2FB|nr:3-phenylpropionate MFS transporter [Necropsobacter massiliensis]